MQTLSKSIVALGAGLSLTLTMIQSAAATCGRVTIARMNWASAEFAAHVDKTILKEGYGCEVSLVPGDTVPALTSMVEKGEPDIAPEVWVNNSHELLAKGVGEGRLVYATEILIDGGDEGWWIPKYVQDANPDIVSIEDALERPDLFKHPEYSDIGAVYSCPSGWACQYINENLFHAYGGEEMGFELVDPGSSAGLDGALAGAYERGSRGWGIIGHPARF